MCRRHLPLLVLILLPFAWAQDNRSVAGEVRTNIEFLNTHDTPIEVFWVNYEGEEELRFELPSGGSLEQPTFVTHPWRAKTKDGEVLLTITAIRRAQQAVVPCARLQEVAESDRPPKLNPDSPPARLGTDLSCVDLRASDLRASNLLGANLLGSSLQASDLSASVLRDADSARGRPAGRKPARCRSDRRQPDRRPGPRGRRHPVRGAGGRHHALARWIQHRTAPQLPQVRGHAPLVQAV